jgi:hypothetical protein
MFLSVVVVIVSDTLSARRDVSHLEGTLDALARQVDPPPMEVLVPHLPPVEGLEHLRKRFPAVRFISVTDLKTYAGKPGSREHHDELRARGIAASRGEIVALLEDHGRPDPHWCSRLATAHRLNWIGVGGAIENGIDRLLNWAVYFSDFGYYQNPVPAGESRTISDVNASYKRAALESIRPVWEEQFNQVEVNTALLAKGERLLLSPDIVVRQHRLNLRLADALKERCVWGRSFAASRCRRAAPARRALYALFAPALPALLLARMAANVIRKGRCRGPFLRALPLTILLAVAWSLGELAGYWTGRP